MGNWFTQDTNPIDNVSEEMILGSTSSERPDLLTEQDEKVVRFLISEIEKFFESEDKQSLYADIIKYRKILKYSLGDKFSLMNYMMKKCWNTEGLPKPKEGKVEFMEAEIAKLMRKTTNLTARDLDKLWFLFYASGDTSFPHRIKEVSDDLRQHKVIRETARWSCDTHEKKGFNLNFPSRLLD